MCIRHSGSQTWLSCRKEVKHTEFLGLSIGSVFCLVVGAWPEKEIKCVFCCGVAGIGRFVTQSTLNANSVVRKRCASEAAGPRPRQKPCLSGFRWNMFFRIRTFVQLARPGVQAEHSLYIICAQPSSFLGAIHSTPAARPFRGRDILRWQNSSKAIWALDLVGLRIAGFLATN